MPAEGLLIEVIWRALVDGGVRRATTLYLERLHLTYRFQVPHQRLQPTLSNLIAGNGPEPITIRKLLEQNHKRPRTGQLVPLLHGLDRHEDKALFQLRNLPLCLIIWRRLPHEVEVAALVLHGVGAQPRSLGLLQEELEQWTLRSMARLLQPQAFISDHHVQDLGIRLFLAICISATA